MCDGGISKSICEAIGEVSIVSCNLVLDLEFEVEQLSDARGGTSRQEGRDMVFFVFLENIFSSSW
jgi:hypothetical protein